LAVVVTEGNVWPWLRGDAGLAAAGMELRFVAYDDTAALRAALEQADVYCGTYYGEELRGAASDRLRTFLVTAAGVDQIPREAIPAGVVVCNSYGHGRAIAEYVAMTVLATRRELFWRDAELRAGRWRTRLVDPTLKKMRNIDGAPLGIVSVGHIGVEIARLATALGMRCRGVTRTPDKDFAGREFFERVDGMDALPELCSHSEVVAVTTPGNAATAGMIGRDLMRRLGPDGTLINVGRGTVVDEKALYECLRSGELGSAAIDVWNSWASEDLHPPSPFDFAALDNIIMTPHYSATTEDTYRLRALDIAANLRAVAEARPLANVVYATSDAKTSA
jgi:phosphoglycerate dehydrogenase-like enzyme